MFSVEEGMGVLFSWERSKYNREIVEFYFSFLKQEIYSWNTKKKCD